MKSLILFPLILIVDLAFANFAQIVECPESLKAIKKPNGQAECRQGKGSAISLYSPQDEKVYIDEGATSLKILDFDVSKAQHCLDLNPMDQIDDVIFYDEIGKWIIYKAKRSLSLDMVYLLDKNYSLDKLVLTFLLEDYKTPLGEMINFEGNKAKVVNKEGKVFTVDVTLPTLDELKRDAFNFYEVRSSVKNGLGDYPAYPKVVSIFKKCEIIARERKRKRCFQKEGKLLQLNILDYVKKNFEDNDETRSLLEYLGEDKNFLKELYVANKLFRGYRELKKSEVMDFKYSWEKRYAVVVNTINHFGSAPAHQLTYFLNTGHSYLSIGEFAYLPSRFSVRFAYYPIGMFFWE